MTQPVGHVQMHSAMSFVAGIVFAGVGWLVLSNSEEFAGRMVPGSTEFLTVVTALILFGIALGWLLPDGLKGLAAAGGAVLVACTLLTSDMAWVGLIWILALLPMFAVGLGWLLGRGLRFLRP